MEKQLERFLIGTDIGTQGTKTGVYKLDGSCIGMSFRPSSLKTGKDGRITEKPEAIYRSVTDTMAEAVRKACISPLEVAAIGIDAQMAGILGIDENYTALTEYDSWLDTSCNKYLEKMRESNGAKIIEKTGCGVTIAHGPKILWWREERPEVYKKIKKFIVLSSYIVGRLTGLPAEDAYIDTTQLHFSGFGDVNKCEWCSELLESFSVDIGKLPRIIKPTEIIGGLTKEAALHCGLSAGTPVCAGCGDQAAASLGAGITKSGMAFEVSGTASVFSCAAEDYAPDSETGTLLYPRSAVEGLWIPMAYLNGGGLCIRWARDKLFDGIEYKSLDESASALGHGSDGLVFLPYSAGRACPGNAKLRGGFLGLDFAHSRLQMYRAVLESICFEYDIYADCFERTTGMRPTAVRTLGGGAKSRFFNQIKADILNMDFVTLSVEEPAPLAAAMLAGIGAGLFSNLAEKLDTLVRECERVTPNPARHEEYKGSIKRYRQFRKASENIFEE